MRGPTRLGIRENLAQFSLLVAVNGFVGAMVGLERSVLPLLASREFGIASASVTLSFIVAFGLVKAFANLAAGRWADNHARKPLLVAGWVAALPVAPMIILAPSWGWVVAANVLLGVNQGLSWSAAVIMKVDLAGPLRRGTATGINEVAGYGAVALAAMVTGALAATYGPRPAPYVLGIGISVAGLVISAVFVRETSDHVALEARSHDDTDLSFRDVLVLGTWRDRALSTVSLAGFVNNLNDGMVWGLLPLYLASRGLGAARIGIVAALYPGVWAVGQLVTGPWSDRVGRKRLIVAGLGVQSAGIAAVVGWSGYAPWALAAVAMGAGTAMVYPTLLAAVGDVAHPTWRATSLGVYRLWRDLGYVGGALLSGVVADVLGMSAAIMAVAIVTAATSLAVWVRMPKTQIVPMRRRVENAERRSDARSGSETP